MLSLSVVDQALQWALPLLLAVTLHEAAHGYAARALGDDTAARLGRLSLNPLRHVDPLGTVVLPGLLLLAGAPFLFGWAKPVPVNMRRLRHPKSDMVWVALAGPATNLAQAVVATLLLGPALQLPEPAADWLLGVLQKAMLINLVLAVFNMIPLPPLDGGRVAVGILPLPLAAPLARLERHGMLILLGALLLLPWFGRTIGLHLDPFGWVIRPVVRFLFTGLLGWFGPG